MRRKIQVMDWLFIKCRVPSRKVPDTKIWRRKHKDGSSAADSLVHFLICLQQPKTRIARSITDMFCAPLTESYEKRPFCHVISLCWRRYFQIKTSRRVGGLKPNWVTWSYTPLLLSWLAVLPSFMLYSANTFVYSSSWNDIVHGAWISP